MLTHFTLPSLRDKPVWRILLVYAFASLILDAISNPQTILPLALAPWTPPIGLSLAFMLLFGVHYAPWLTIVTFLVGMPVHGMPQSWLQAVWAAVLVMSGLAGICLWLQKRIGIDVRLSSQRDLFWFLVAALFAAWLDALVHVFSRNLVIMPGLGVWLADLVNYWVGALIRLLIVTPLVLVFADIDWRALRNWRPTREMAGQALVIILALTVIFGLKFTDEFKFFYLLFLPLVWVCVRHGIRGATLALAFIHAGLNAIFVWRELRSVTVAEFQMLMLGLAITGLFLGMTVTSRRVMEEKLHRREADLNQAMRTASAGQMTQAIAHELNQPLSALANYARAAQSMLKTPEQHAHLLADTLEKIVQESTRAGQVVRRLREFFRGGVLRMERVSVTDLIEEGLAPARRRAERAGIELQVMQHDAPESVLADRVQIGTVLHNLLVNAIEAIEQAQTVSPHPRVVVEARRSGMDKISICVTDNGCGIDTELGQRLFDPFVTSKAEGMGLGLAISRTLVEAHGGELHLHSERPTRFCFTLPIRDQEAPHA